MKDADASRPARADVRGQPSGDPVRVRITRVKLHACNLRAYLRACNRWAVPPNVRWRGCDGRGRPMGERRRRPSAQGTARARAHTGGMRTGPQGRRCPCYAKHRLQLGEGPYRTRQRYAPEGTRVHGRAVLSACPRRSTTPETPSAGRSGNRSLRDHQRGRRRVRDDPAHQPFDGRARVVGPSGGLARPGDRWCGKRQPGWSRPVPLGREGPRSRPVPRSTRRGHKGAID